MFVLVKIIGTIYGIVGPFNDERSAVNWMSSNVDTDEWKYWVARQLTPPEDYDE